MNMNQLKKIEQKVKPSIEIKKSENLKTPKEDIIIKEKNKTSIKLEKEKKLAEDFNINFAYEPYGDKGATGGKDELSMQEDQTNNNESNINGDTMKMIE